MEIQIKKLLQTQEFSKEFRIYGNEVPELTHHIHKIQRLPLEKLCFLQVKKESILDIFVAFQNLNLAHLTLNDCEIDSKVLNFIPNLRSLTLRNYKMRSSEFVTIISAIKHSPSCFTLSLRVAFEDTKTAALIDCIAGSQLVSLEFERCRFEQGNFAAILNAIARAPHAPASPSRTLILWGVSFDDEITRAIIACIKSTSLIKLSLFACTFVADGIGPIMEAIQQSSIQSLGVEFSFFIDDIVKIMDCVKNSSIIKFTFGDERRQYEGEEMVVIANSIRGSNLLKVGLNCAHINNEIYCAIKESSIVSLDLYYDHFYHTKTEDEIEAEVATICDLLECGNLKKLKMMIDTMNGAHIRRILSSIKKSELIKFYIYDLDRSNVTIKQEIKEIMQKQKLRVTSFNKMKSANAC